LKKNWALGANEVFPDAGGTVAAVAPPARFGVCPIVTRAVGSIPQYGLGRGGGWGLIWYSGRPGRSSCSGPVGGGRPFGCDPPARCPAPRLGAGGRVGGVELVKLGAACVSLLTPYGPLV